MKRATLFLLPLLMGHAGAADAPNLWNAKGAKFPDLPKVAALGANVPGANLPNAAPAAGPGVVIRARVAGPRFVFTHTPPPDAPAGPPEAPTLRWKNGESLQGEIAAATGSELTWKTPLFDDPLQLRWSALDRIVWTQPPVEVTAPFGIALRDGSFIYGDLTSITADSISIHSARLGDAVLKRSEVLSVRRLWRGNLIFSGPLGDAGWQKSANDQNGNVMNNIQIFNGQAQFQPAQTDIAPMTAGPGDALLIRTWNRGAVLNVTVPDRVDAEFRVRSSKRPEFVFVLGGTLRDTLRVETWDDELVLAKGNQFKAIRKLEKDERAVALRVCWDKKAQTCSVYTPAGELITTWPVPGPSPDSNPGLVLQNKGVDLSLEFLRVRNWDGKAPSKVDLKLPRVELADGRILAGEISAGAPGFIRLQQPGMTTPAEFALKDVDALMLSTDTPQVTDHSAALSYADGTIILGTIDSITNGHIALTTSFSRGPLSATMDLIRKLRVHLPEPAGTAPEPPLENQDQIVVEGTTLHGKLESLGNDWPRWTSSGGTKPVRPSKTLPSEITRAFPPDNVPAGDPALFYMTSGDVLPGSLRSLDRSGAEFESSLMEARKLPAGMLQAIQFKEPGGTKVDGFSDAAWRVVKGDAKDVHFDKNTVDLNPGTAIDHPSVMQGSEFSFKYGSNGFSGLRLRLFCPGPDSSHSMNILLGNTGNQFISGLEQGEGQFQDETQIGIKSGDPVTIRVTIEDSQVQLFINGVSSQQYPIDPARRGGSGLILEPASLWGNSVFHVSLSDFAAKSVPGRTWLPEVSDDIKTQVLTIPRFQKDDPPRHLLLGPNGDVLRGEIEAATTTHFGFRSGLENLDVPRDRVSAVIWLKQPDKNAPPPPPTAPVANPLNRMLEMRTMFSSGRLDNFIGFLQQQDDELKITYPHGDTRQFPMQLGGQTVGEALGRICAVYNLRYRVETDGTVVLEGASAPSGDVAAKSYWLKPDAFPEKASVQDILSAKGITFPKGTAVTWEPAADLLTMTNTADNQAALAKLLDSDFGGHLGAPTHWLELTSGGRLALQVDKFEPDAIVGHHPLYGVCKVPMSQVYAIRTTAPEPTGVAKSLDGWQLVNAPEPVIPGTGGESSPLLGKEAVAFKLPLLDGGDFDLSAEKRHVVVLDFWATWCGPCIKSLPGLIDTMAAFPSDKVKLIGLNQGEAPEQVKRFLAARNLKIKVALDADQGVGQKYGADAIPLTVIIGPDGKVAWVQTGYDPDGDAAASDVVKRLLAPASAANTPAPESTQ